LLISFAEHARKISDRTQEYLKEIEHTSTDRVKIIAGFQAQILIDGSIIALKKIRHVVFDSELSHKYHSKLIWLQALKRTIEKPDVDVIGHIAPQPPFTRGPNEIKEMVNIILHNNKPIEINAKDHRPPIEWIQIFRKKNAQPHLESDVHSLDEISRFEKISDLIALREEGR
jgi:putative hydrolase